MFARSVSVGLKANSVAEFARTLENEVIPLLRKQKGFQDAVSLVDPNGTEAVAISFWDRKENAEAYNRGAYPEVQKALANVLDGTPQVKPMRFRTRPSTRLPHRPQELQPEIDRPFSTRWGGQVRLVQVR